MHPTLALALTLLAGQITDSNGIGVYVVETSEMRKGADKKLLDFPPRDGLLVLGLFPYSPASEAKMRPYDIIQNVNGKPIKTREEYDQIMVNAKPGEKLKLEVLQQINTPKRMTWGKKRTVNVMISTRRSIAMASLRRDRDRVTGDETIWHKDSPESGQGENDLSLYFAVKDGKPGLLKVRASYHDKDWVFSESVVLSKNENPVVLVPPSTDWNTDVVTGGVNEWAFAAVSEEQLKKLSKMLLETSVIVRHNGSKFKHDREFTSEERSRMMSVIDAYLFMKAEAK